MDSGWPDGQTVHCVAVLVDEHLVVLVGDEEVLRSCGKRAPYGGRAGCD